MLDLFTGFFGTFFIIAVVMLVAAPIILPIAWIVYAILNIKKI